MIWKLFTFHTVTVKHVENIDTRRTLKYWRRKASILVSLRTRADVLKTHPDRAQQLIGGAEGTCCYIMFQEPLYLGALYKEAAEQTKWRHPSVRWWFTDRKTQSQVCAWKDFLDVRPRARKRSPAAPSSLQRSKNTRCYFTRFDVLSL